MPNMKDLTTEDLTELLYKSYGTDSGCIFGLKPEQKQIVASIVRAIQNLLEWQEEQKEG